MCAPAAMPRPGLDHAAEHHAEPERACSVRHAHGLADPARLRELDVDPVRALGAARRRRRACGSPRRRRSEPATGASAPARRGSPAGSGCSQYWRSICGRYSSASSSDQYSFTSTCSGRSVTPRTARTRSTSSPSRPPSLSLSRRKRPSRAAFSARRAMSSGSPSQIVHDVGGPVAAQAEQPVHRQAEQLALEVVQRRVDRGARGELLARQPVEDLVERERIVAERVRVRLEVRERGLGRLVVAVDRRRLAEAARVAVPELDLDDLGLVLRLARDRERLGETQRRRRGRSASTRARLMRSPAPVAQGIERAPPEREVVGSIPAGRIASRTARRVWLNGAGRTCHRCRDCSDGDTSVHTTD